MRKEGSMRFVVLVGILIMVLMPCVFSLEQGIHLVRPITTYIESNLSVPSYLSLEDITFIACLEEENIPLQLSVICIDDNDFEDLVSYPWGDSNCQIGSINLEDFSCTHVRLSAEYEMDGENNRMTQDVLVSKYSKVLDKVLSSQYSDGGWRTTKDTTYGIWALSHFPKIFDYEIDQAMTWLKLERNEEEKCFPQSPCNVPLTMEILAILTESGFDDARRVVNDARNWIENKQFYYQQEDMWTVEVESPVDNAHFVLVAKDKDLLDTNFSLPNNTARIYNFTATMDSTIYVISHDNFEGVIYDKYGIPMYRYTGNNLTYKINGACWSTNKKGEPCDERTTAYASLLDLHKPNIREAKRYMFSAVNFSDIVGAYFGSSEDVIGSSMFLATMYNMSETEYIADYTPYMERFDYMDEGEQYDRYIYELRNWILFMQNNEGSWGDDNASINEKAYHTAHGVLGLLYSGMNRSNEPITDAEEWLSDMEDYLTINDTVALGSAFYVLENYARPMLTSVPGVVVVDNAEVTFSLFNPTTFNLRELSYNLSGELPAYITIDEKETISSYSYRSVQISRKATPTGSVEGYLTVSNLGEEVAKIPVVVADYPFLNITSEDTLTVFGKRGTIRLQAKKSSHAFTCRMVWDSGEISSDQTVQITSGSASLNFVFSQPETKEDLYKGTLTCTAGNDDYTFPISVYVTRYSSYPLTLSPQSIYINSSSEHPVFYIKNNLDSDLSPDITIEAQATGYFEVVDSINLNPNEERNVTLHNLVPDNENFTMTFSIGVEAFGKKETIPVVVDITYTPKRSLGLVGLIIMLFIIFLVLGVGGYYGYIYRQRLKNLFTSKTDTSIQEMLVKNMQELDKIKTEDQTDSILNMVRLLNFQKKPDNEVKDTLLKYFTYAEVRAALVRGNMVVRGFESEREEQNEPHKS